jgi:hypothetical protein
MGASAARVARERCDARDEARRYVEVLDETRRSDVEELAGAVADRRFGVRRQKRH